MTDDIKDGGEARNSGLLFRSVTDATLPATLGVLLGFGCLYVCETQEFLRNTVGWASAFYVWKALTDHLQRQCTVSLGFFGAGLFAPLLGSLLTELLARGWDGGGKMGIEGALCGLLFLPLIVTLFGHSGRRKRVIRRIVRPAWRDSAWASAGIAGGALIGIALILSCSDVKSAANLPRTGAFLAGIALLSLMTFHIAAIYRVIAGSTVSDLLAGGSACCTLMGAFSGILSPYLPGPQTVGIAALIAVGSALYCVRHAYGFSRRNRYSETVAQRVVIHRFRGFDEYEHTQFGLENASRYAAGFIEFDVRVSPAGVFYVFHGAALGFEFAQRASFSICSEGDLADSDRRNGQTLMKLETAMEALRKAQRAGWKGRALLDIKDYGWEQDILRLVRSFQAESWVGFVSWIPHTLLRMSELQAECPLILSYLSLERFGKLGARVSHALRRINFGSLGLRLMGESWTAKDLPEDCRLNVQHGFVLQALPGFLEKVLRDSGGGICIPQWGVSQDVVDSNRSRGLRVWVFQTGSHRRFLDLATTSGIEAVFHERPQWVLPLIAPTGGNNQS